MRLDARLSLLVTRSALQVPVSGERGAVMTQPIARRIALRAVQLAIVAAGIFVIMLVFSRQAHAATTDTNRLGGAGAPTAPWVTGAVW